MYTRRLFLLLISLLFLLTGCAGTGLPITDVSPDVTLPPAEVTYLAPIGDAALEYKDTATLYLPSHDGIGLADIETDISFSLVRPAAETVMRSLISQTGSREYTSLGGEVRLSLYGANPVEISRNVATVNLSASALQLDRQRLYIACQAIANTLTAIDGIDYVNVLVVDKPVGLDIANTLPMGALKANSSRDLSSVYEQLLAKRVPAGSQAAVPLSAYVALYFPLQNSDGLVCEARPISFENQQLPEMVTAILRALAAGPSDSQIRSPQLPLLADLLTTTPVLQDNPSSGSQIIALDFAHNLDDMLDAYGITRSQCTASLCYTLSSFFPNVSGISLSINGTPVDALYLTEEDASGEESDVFLRAAFSGLIYDYCTLYFADPETQKLAPSSRAIAYYQRTNPRVLLCELAKGPQAGDSHPDLLPVMDEKSITDTTLLGFALSDHTLLVNFAPSFSDLGKGISPQQERLLAYALVNSLCMDERVRSICFFQSGTQFDGFTDEIYWRGLFNPLVLE
ncbi:MAG: GerMN domain-containing protein [Clostridia bacterium]|nr:GerMN domain-containing protein [Clostridia bacterium]